MAGAGAALVPELSTELREAGEAVEAAEEVRGALHMDGLHAEGKDSAKVAAGRAVALRKAERAYAAALKKLEAAKGRRRREAVTRVNGVFQLYPCYHHLVERLAAQGVWDLVGSAKVGTPLQPMTAAPANSVGEVMSRLGAELPFFAEVRRRALPATRAAARGSSWFGPVTIIHRRRLFSRR